MRPPDVRIDDYRSPVFSSEIASLRAQMEPLAGALELTPAALKQAAIAEAGFADFGDTWFEAPLAVLCQALRAEAGLSPAGVVSAWFLLRGLLTNRLLVEDAFRRQPSIADVAIERPIIICGLPRTGTTHLHNLMAADPNLRHLPYWESLEPVPPASATEDGRRARTEDALAVVNGAMPHFVRMHEMTPDHAHEEIQLLAIAGSTMLFETMALMPSWRDWYLSTDQRPAYAYLRRILQLLTWSRGPRRWVLKSPQHLEQFGPLIDTFPDATFVVTHRDPVSVTASMTTMLAYSGRMSVQVVDPDAYGAYWAPRLERMLRSCVTDRALLPSDRSIDVRFDEFMDDDIAMVERIYALAEQPFTSATRDAMAEFMRLHPRGKFGRVAYDLADFGLDAAERRQALTFYSSAFGV